MQCLVSKFILEEVVHAKTRQWLHMTDFLFKTISSVSYHKCMLSQSLILFFCLFVFLFFVFFNNCKDSREMNFIESIEILWKITLYFVQNLVALLGNYKIILLNHCQLKNFICNTIWLTYTFCTHHIDITFIQKNLCCATHIMGFDWFSHGQPFFQNSSLIFRLLRFDKRMVKLWVKKT